jgi:hypothetical protein
VQGDRPQQAGATQSNEPQQVAPTQGKEHSKNKVRTKCKSKENKNTM